MNKCQCVYRTTILAAVAFLDAFQKVADMATNSRGKIVFSINSSVWGEDWVFLSSLGVFALIVWS